MTDDSPEARPAKKSAATAAQAKSIILFSDGTGNSSAKLFKTNVWRMYEAVALGPDASGKRKQIAFYDDGVGTSGFAPLAMLGGVFGVGLRRNVLDIYRYACRNYRPADGQLPGQENVDGGDEIYGFGFSRGAFTMRIAIAMIAKVGLAVTNHEEELDRKARAAWRIFRSKYRPSSPLAPANIWRRLIRGDQKADAAANEALHQERSRNFHPVIRFVGVWDTVAAYGGPISEITEAIDKWFIPLSMPNYALADSVRCARHALAIDDERDAFHPLPWDEVYEKSAIEAAKRKEKPHWIDDRRLEQVWFTGMHADVGGGYPDESLSYISFLWMMEEAEKEGLRTLQTVTERFRALASSAGPLHDSRAGVGAYYRYQPRNIAAWVDPTHPSLLSRRHPELDHGLLVSVRVHESVIARIDSGTDRYAPIALPAALRVAPQEKGENVQQADNQTPSVPPVDDQPRVPLISEELRRLIENEDLGRARVEAMRPVWKQVVHRRIAYFAALASTLALVTMPLWIGRAPVPPVFASGHGAIGRSIEAVSAFLPAFVGGLIATWAASPFYFLLLLLLIFGARSVGSRLERSLRDRTRSIWSRALGQDEPLPEAPTTTEPAPQPNLGSRVARWMKWNFLPALIGILFVVILLWLLLAVVSRVALAFHERDDSLCAAPTGSAPELAAVRIRFDTATPCHAVGARVARGERYIVDFDVIDLWKDGDKPASPAGLSAGDIGWAGYAGLPMRRAIGANYMQPMLHIRGATDWGGPSIRPIALRQQGSPRTRWRAEFVAERTGELSIFVNESVLPFPMPLVERENGRWRWETRPVDYFYRNSPHANSGTACVTIVHAGSVGAAGPAASGSCAPAMPAP